MNGPEKIWENGYNFVIHWFQVCQLSLHLNMRRTRDFLSGLMKSPALEQGELPFLKPRRELTNQ